MRQSKHHNKGFGTKKNLPRGIKESIEKDDRVEAVVSFQTTGYIFSWIVTLATFFVYVMTIHQSLPGGDSGELVVAAQELGVAHPPGYPLFTLLARAVLSLMCSAISSPVLRVNILCAAMGAMASGLLYLLILRLTQRQGAALIAAGMFGLSRLVWTWSCVAEVFSLNNFLLGGLMLTAVWFDTCKKSMMIKAALVGSLLCGLCLSNQHTSVVYIVVLVPWVLYRLWTAELLSAQLLFLQLPLTFLSGLTPYLYLPVSAVLHRARWTWGDQSSVSGFLRHLLRLEYGTWDLLKDHKGQGFLSGLMSYVLHIISDLSAPTLVLLPLSVGSIYYRYKTSGSSVLLVFLIMWFGYVSFFCWRANLDISNPIFLKVVERFWMQSDLVVVVLAAVAFADVSRYISKKLKLSGYHFEVLLAAPVLAWQIHSNWATCDNSTNVAVRDFAIQTLAAFPNNSIVLTKGDLPSNSLRYFHLCEGVRPDLSVFDQEVLTYRWSLPMTRKFYPDINFPGDFLHLHAGRSKDGSKAFTFKQLIDANIHRPIFACIGMQEHEPSWQESYELWPFSVCWRIIKKGTTLNTKQWTMATSHLANQWTHLWGSFEEGTWERVANEEMWRAKTVTAYFYLELSYSQPADSDEYKELLRQSFEIYTAAFEGVSPQDSNTNNNSSRTFNVPAYWHRNYAIVCERLSRTYISDDQGIPLGSSQDRKTDLPTAGKISQRQVPSQLSLMKLTVEHFKMYVSVEPNDPDSANIQKAIDSLQAYIDTVSKDTD